MVRLFRDFDSRGTRRGVVPLIMRGGAGARLRRVSREVLGGAVSGRALRIPDDAFVGNDSIASAEATETSAKLRSEPGTLLFLARISGADDSPNRAIQGFPAPQRG
jgi:hypothetical protein